MITKKFITSAFFLLLITIPSPGLTTDQLSHHDSASQYFKTGISLFDQGNYEQALSAFQKATEDDPNYAEAYYNLAIIYDLQGRFSEAIEAYRKVVQIDPQVGTVLKNLAQDCYLTGRLKEAMDYIKLAESLGKPADKDLYNKIWAEYKGLAARPKTARNSKTRGRMIDEGRKLPPPSEAQDTKELEKINRQIESAIASLEAELAAQQQQKEKAAKLIDLGIKYRQRGEIDKSIDVLTKALSLSASKMLIYAELGLCYYFKDRKDLFVQNFTQAKKNGFRPSKSLNDLYLQCLAKR